MSEWVGLSMEGKKGREKEEVHFYSSSNNVLCKKPLGSNTDESFCFCFWQLATTEKNGVRLKQTDGRTWWKYRATTTTTKIMGKINMDRKIESKIHLCDWNTIYFILQSVYGFDLSDVVVVSAYFSLLFSLNDYNFCSRKRSHWRIAIWYRGSQINWSGSEDARWIGGLC